jgi:hypothetical protein
VRNHLTTHAQDTYCPAPSLAQEARHYAEMHTCRQEQINDGARDRPRAPDKYQRGQGRQQRLIDTKIIVDQYLETPRAGERSVQSIVERAMIIDRMALSVWNARLMSDDRVPLATIDALHEFPSRPNVRPITTRIRDNYPNSTDRANVGVDSSFTENLLPSLWACAADQIRSAEREMAKRGAKR